MDLLKESDLFEQWWGDEGQYHRAGGDDYCKTFAWEAWIFVKNQAIPDGFVLVSQKKLLELFIAINAADLATHTEEKPNEVREMWQQVALKLGALCSTGAS